MAQKRNYKSFRNLDTYDLAGGLALEGHSSSPTLALAEISGEGSFPSWTLRPPPLGKPSSSSLLPLGESPLSPPRLRGRSPPRSHRTMSPISPGAGNFFEFPWPSSWPSSPAPHRVPGPAAPLSGHPLGLREGEPDSLPVRTSSASPVKGIGSFRSHITLNYERK